MLLSTRGVFSCSATSLPARHGHGAASRHASCSGADRSHAAQQHCPPGSQQHTRTVKFESPSQASPNRSGVALQHPSGRPGPMGIFGGQCLDDPDRHHARVDSWSWHNRAKTMSRRVEYEAEAAWRCVPCMYGGVRPLAWQPPVAAGKRQGRDNYPGVDCRFASVEPKVLCWGVMYGPCMHAVSCALRICCSTSLALSYMSFAGMVVS